MHSHPAATATGASSASPGGTESRSSADESPPAAFKDGPVVYSQKRRAATNQQLRESTISKPAPDIDAPTRDADSAATAATPAVTLATTLRSYRRE